MHNRANMTTRRAKPKALWHQIKHGDATQAKRRRPIRRMSKRLARDRRKDCAIVRDWIKGKPCDAAGLYTATGPVCSFGPHKATDRHHTRGRLGPLLHDQRYWLPLCRRAHDFVRDHPAEAKRLGLIQGPWNHQPKKAI